jgi:hypothetical protein
LDFFWDTFRRLFEYFWAEMEKCSNVPKMFLGKNLCKIIHCFFEKVSSVAISCFVGNGYGNFRLLSGIFWHILHLCVSFWPFLHCFGLLGFLRSFVKNKI